MERKDPVVREIHLSVHAFGGHLRHAVDLEHLLDGEVNLSEIGAKVDGIGHR
jgi:hypothetical protein